MNPLIDIALKVVSKTANPQFLQALQTRTDVLKRLELAKKIGSSPAVRNNLSNAYKIITQMMSKL